MTKPLNSGACFSPCRTWRYGLYRDGSDAKEFRWNAVAFIGLNPSTADESADDSTIRRCIGYARDWGFNALIMLNLFGFRATDPKVMKRATDPVGVANDAHIRGVRDKFANLIVAAWGTHGAFMRRDTAVRAMVPNLHYLQLTKDGHPNHPLYLPKSLTPQPW